MPNLAQITIAGHAGGDAELQYTQSGDARATFSVAVNTRDDNTIWYRVTVWRGYAEVIAPLVKKGAVVTVIGRFQPRTYTGNDGIERISYDIDANYVIVAGKAEPVPRTETSTRSGDIPF